MLLFLIGVIFELLLIDCLKVGLLVVFVNCKVVNWFDVV